MSYRFVVGWGKSKCDKLWQGGGYDSFLNCVYLYVDLWVPPSDFWGWKLSNNQKNQKHWISWFSDSFWSCLYLCVYLWVPPRNFLNEKIIYENKIDFFYSLIHFETVSVNTPLGIFEWKESNNQKKSKILILLILWLTLPLRVEASEAPPLRPTETVSPQCYGEEYYHNSEKRKLK